MRDYILRMELHYEATTYHILSIPDPIEKPSLGGAKKIFLDDI